jgi:hypothetical protein
MDSDIYPNTLSDLSCTSPEIDDTASECLTSYYDDFSSWECSCHRDYDSHMDCCTCNPDSFAISRATDEIAWIFEPYHDFRSAGRAKQRERKTRENRPNRTGYRCRMEWQSDCRGENKRKKKAITRCAKMESQKEGYVGCRVLEWDIHLPEELDRLVREMEDLKHYQILHQNASTLETAEPYVEFGELFAPWAQRRVTEMRFVKESRVQRNALLTAKPMIWQDKFGNKHGEQYAIYTGDASTTTLPTTRWVTNSCAPCWIQGKWWVEKCLREGKPVFRAIQNYRWFGEYDWHWHRDVMGRWEIGEGRECTATEVDAGDASALEEVRRCSLFEWLGEDGREIVARNEARVNEWTRLLDDDGDVFGPESDCGWSVVSRASSETWSVVDTP